MTEAEVERALAEGEGPQGEFKRQIDNLEETRSVEQLGKLRVCRLKENLHPLNEEILESYGRQPCNAGARK